MRQSRHGERHCREFGNSAGSGDGGGTVKLIACVVTGDRGSVGRNIFP